MQLMCLFQVWFETRLLKLLSLSGCKTQLPQGCSSTMIGPSFEFLSRGHIPTGRIYSLGQEEFASFAYITMTSFLPITLASQVNFNNLGRGSLLKDTYQISKMGHAISLKSIKLPCCPTKSELGAFYVIWQYPKGQFL